MTAEQLRFCVVLRDEPPYGPPIVVLELPDDAGLVGQSVVETAWVRIRNGLTLYRRRDGDGALLPVVVNPAAVQTIEGFYGYGDL